MSGSAPNLPYPGILSAELQHTERFRVLPEVNRLLLNTSDVRGTFPRICRRIHRVLAHQHAAIALFDSDSSQFRIFAEHVYSGTQLPPGLALPLPGTPYGEVYRLRRPIVVDDLRSPRYDSDTTRRLLDTGRRSGCWAPLQTADRLLGALSVSANRPGAYRESDAALLNEIAGQISLALAMQLGLEQVKVLQHQLDESISDWNRSFKDIAASVSCGVVQWGAGGAISDANASFLDLVGRTRKDVYRGLNCSDISRGTKFLGQRLRAETELCDSGTFKPFLQEYIRGDGTSSTVLVTSAFRNQRRPPWLALVVVVGESATPVGRLTSGYPGSEPDLSDTELFGANSPTMGRLLHEIEKIAPTDTNVLLSGETGTGKDVLARTIYEMSGRRHRPLITISCATSRGSQLEHELFGSDSECSPALPEPETGKLGQAHEATLFLDEVGELPLEFQARLLRFFQDREFGRLGGTEPTKVNIRIIAASSRNLPAMVIAGTFSRDLYHWLNGFPVRIPPLRERPECIAAFARHFVRLCAYRLQRPPLTISAQMMGVLERWSWPGNIWELDNVIQRSVILSPGPDLLINPDQLRAIQPDAFRSTTLMDVERDHITRILEETGGIVSGEHGAALILGMKRTTLQYRMKKLHISPK